MEHLEQHCKRRSILLKGGDENEKKLDITILLNYIKDFKARDRFMDYYIETMDLIISPTNFYEYQQKLVLIPLKMS